MTDHSARLEPFLLLARSTKGAAAAKVISDATAANGTYVFAELIELPNIQELKGDQTNGKAFALLELFAYGTLDDYKKSYPTLSTSHMYKLKQLSLVSLAMSHRSIQYDNLLSSLDVASIRELEDLIIDVIYAGLLKGKMHHHEKILHVDWVGGRDVSASDLPTIQQGLQNWSATASSLLAALDEEIDRVRKETQNVKSDQMQFNLQRNYSYGKVMEQHAKAIPRERRSERIGTGGNGGNGFPTTENGGGKGNGGSMGSKILAGLGGGGGRVLGARNPGQPDELAGMRGAKRHRE